MAANARDEFKVKINPALLAALDHFAGRSYNWAQPTLFRFTNPKDGHQSDWPVERCCAIAHEIIADEDLNYLKLKALQAGLKKYGMERLYEDIMGEKLP